MRFVMLVVLFFSSAVGAQEPATFSVSVVPERVRVGETATVWIDVTLSDDWHIYSATTPEGGPYPTEFVLIGKGFVQNGAVIQPPPIKEHDPNFDMMVEYYNKSVRFGMRVKVMDDAVVGATTLSGEVTYMLCNATSCLPPNTYVYNVPVQIELGQPRPEYVIAMASMVSKSEDSDLDGTGSIADVDRALSQGLGAFLY
ncbi:MAG: protein-disulfide reductase DsbD domain-containing protein, partial [Candidatus Latescibacterota bacterium]